MGAEGSRMISVWANRRIRWWGMLWQPKWLAGGIKWCWLYTGEGTNCEDASLTVFTELPCQ
jgi:hypothetical protein